VLFKNTKELPSWKLLYDKRSNESMKGNIYGKPRASK
jgi:hypothetical protein